MGTRVANALEIPGNEDHPHAYGDKGSIFLLTG